MNRRLFLALTCGAAVWPFAARAQQRVARIGVLLFGRVAQPQQLVLASELARLGYVEHRNIAYEIRSAEGELARLPALARELVATKPDVLVGASSPAAAALVAVTRDIPIVMTVIGDPIALRLTSSMSRPTRNITGFTTSSVSLVGKRLEPLRELVPDLRKVAYLFAPSSPMVTTLDDQVHNAADRLGITLVPLPVTTKESLIDGFALADREQVQAALVETNSTSPSRRTHRKRMHDARLPAMHTWYFEVHEGALMSYGPAVVENHAGSAKYIDRILNGAHIAELPFEEPTLIKLVINLRTARSMEISIPSTLLARADEVIE